jgi:peptidoglycan hydrolase CwlO-like protein
MHRMVMIIAAVFVIGFIEAITTVPSSSADRQNTEGSKGVTVDDLGRGVKSAAQNIEKEIPKMGSAIGNAFKKITEQGSGKSSSQEAGKQKQ